MKELSQTLSKLGIEENQAKVYMALLELGSATVQEAARKSGIKRTSIYNFLDEMEQDGLISIVQQGHRILLIAEDPNNLIKKSKQNTLAISKIIPALMGMYNMPGNKPKIKYYQGIEGLKKSYESILKQGGTQYIISDYEKMLTTKNLGWNKWIWNYPSRRIARDIDVKCIAKAGPMAKKVKAKDKLHSRQTRILKGEGIELDTEINIYENTVVMISFRRPYAGVIIEDRSIAMTMKSLWQIIWKSLK